MKLSLNKAILATVVVGLAAFALAVTTSAPHGQSDPPLADAGWLVGFAAVGIAVVLLLAAGVRAGMRAGRSRAAR